MIKPKLIVIGGSIATGKTTLAYRLKHYFQDKNGIKHHIVESDTVRRNHLGYSLGHVMQESDYSKQIDDVIYPLMDMMVTTYLENGENAIRTVTGLSQKDYQNTKEQADKHNADFIGIFLQASEKNIRQRIKKRLKERDLNENLSVESGHASDACEGVLDKYPIPDFTPDGWIVLNADQDPDQVFADCVKALGL